MECCIGSVIYIVNIVTFHFKYSTHCSNLGLIFCENLAQCVKVLRGMANCRITKTLMKQTKNVTYAKIHFPRGPELSTVCCMSVDIMSTGDLFLNDRFVGATDEPLILILMLLA